MPQSIGEQLDAQGWQAGAVVSQAMLPQLGPHMTRPGRPDAQVNENHWIVVVSQTCDVVQAKLENEPLVEVLHCTPVPELRPEFQGRKSTRRLDFRPNKEGHAGVVLSAHAIADRYVVPRKLFADHEPDPDRRLSDSAISNIQQWYALRYTRPAWPDAFNERFNKKVKKKLAAALKLLSTDGVEVRVAIAENDRELEADQTYHMAVFFVVDQLVWDSDPVVREEAHKAFAAFVSALAECKGVEPDQELSGVKTGDEFTWQLTRTTDEWNFANLSEQE